MSEENMRPGGERAVETQEEKEKRKGVSHNQGVRGDLHPEISNLFPSNTLKVNISNSSM